MGYGYTTKSGGKSKTAAATDAYAMLLTVRGGGGSPILHWKTRLPEANLTAGLLVSPCGHYVVGGGGSGNLYVWKTLGGAPLLRVVVKAHYRAIQHMVWCSRQRLATGGADGMVHVFELADLVAASTTTSVTPLRTWSGHHLPITALVALSETRLASASRDGKVLLLHVPSHQVWATLQMPSQVTTLAVNAAATTLYAGSHTGGIFVVRLDEYAVHKLAQEQGVAVRSRRVAPDANPSDAVWGEDPAAVTTTTTDGVHYRTELKGHSRPVSSLTVLEESDNDGPVLCSGDTGGCLRIWDLASGTCLHVTRPWSTSRTAASSSSHPITSLVVLRQPLDADEAAPTTVGMFTHGAPASALTSAKRTLATSLVPLLAPLQKFRADDSAADKVLLPVWNTTVPRPPRDVQASHAVLRQRRAKRRHAATAVQDVVTSDASSQARIALLERQLEEAQSTIQRWETVNQKLLLRLPQAD
jgi:WD40 repeat protein